MKRRNADCGKIRRPIKRNKIAEQIGSNTLLYVKFLLLWAFVITADFLLEFRFEFLWPFWLLLRSVYDSFKYKGLAFSVLFVCIAITSDLVCLFFIPVQWLFFAASTYVWVQYVWHTDKGICLPTIILWILFVYLEAAIRWKDSRNIPHLDLCRPFAAHCIGYPVVTLGFGFKSYVGYRIRQRKQREVAKDNDFYMQLLQEALPKDESAANGGDSHHVNGHAGGGSGSSSAVVTATTSSNGSSTMNGGSRSSTTDSSHSNGAASSPKEKKDCDSASTASSSPTTRSQFDSVPAASTQSQNHDKKHQQNGHVVNYEPSAAEHLQQPVESDPPVTEPKAASNRSGRKNRVKQKSDQQLAAVRLAATLALASSITTLTTTTAAATTTTTTAAAKDNHPSDAPPPNNTQNGSNQQQTGPPPPPVVQTVVQTVKVCETCARMEADAKKLRTELGQLRQNENELRQKYDSNTANLKSCLQVKQKEHDELQTRFQELTAQRQQERQSLQTVERRLGEERRHRQSLESQLQNERKHRKQAEEKAARASADCGEQCKLKRQQMDHELRELRRELMSSEEAKHNAESASRSIEQEMRKFEVQLRNRESQQSSEVLMSALAAMQDKNATLEKNLSAETRVKLDLFSALGETRRQLEIATCSLRTRDKEILDLKAKMVQILAVMPAMPNDSLCLTGPGPTSSSGSSNVGGLRLSDAPQLLSVSALNGGGGGGGQPSPMSQHLVMNSPPLINQLGALGVLTSTITTSTAPAMVLPSMQHHQQQQQQSGLMTVANGQLVQMQQQQQNSANCPSNLDPNASVYTPKNCAQQQQQPQQQVGGTEA
ncbi:conserved hypothetical protein [Culex quinquefasciatus]|uniref:Macoilin n=1 Tax=Culex quinquefasciatus TaxID=7176 RepID=B0WF83_CULQU|nr:conserved hypothetical protein [Culex quinquefasciatus]|eukprot:XP_001847367.1 conserved hypothetical protein [Culex quinquefasciatus]